MKTVFLSIAGKNRKKAALQMAWKYHIISLSKKFLRRYFPLNRLAMMVLKNLHRIPGVYGKLCRYAKTPDQYPADR